MAAYRVMILRLFSLLLILCTMSCFAFDYCGELKGNWVIPLYNVNNHAIKRFVNMHVYQVKPILDAHGFYNLIGTADGETLVDSKCIQTGYHIMTVTVMTQNVNLRAVDPVSVNSFEGFYRNQFVVPPMKHCVLCLFY